MARPAASDVTVTVLGLISFQADLLNIAENPRKETGFKMVCPECPAPTVTDQRYLCPSGHGPFSSGQMAKAQEVDKVLHFISTDEVSAVKEKELPAKVANFGLYPAREVAAATHTSGSIYRLRVDKAVQQVQVVLALVREGSYVFVAEVNLGGRTGQKLFRLSEWNGHLVMEELARPELVVPFDVNTETAPAELVAKATQLASTQVESFDPAKFSSKVRERAMALADAKRSGQAVATPTTPTVTKVDPAQDLMDLLSKALGQ